MYQRQSTFISFLFLMYKSQNVLFLELHKYENVLIKVHYDWFQCVVHYDWFQCVPRAEYSLMPLRYL